MVKKVLLDTNFIISCLKNRIDFLEELQFGGFEIYVPEQVLRELENLKDYSAKIALNLLKEKRVEKVVLPVNYVDEGIARFCERHRDFVLATLDKELLDRVANPKMIIRNRKNLEIIY